MSQPKAVDLVQLFLLLVSVPAYIWFIATIIRFRKKKPFDSPFFSLCLSLAAADLQCLAANLVLGKFAFYEWLGVDELVRKYPYKMGKIFNFLVIYGCLQQFTGVTLMSFNRYTALAHFNKHKTIWSHKFTRGVILYEFLGPFLLATPILLSDPKSFSYEIDEETGQIGPVTVRNPKLQMFCAILFASYLWLCNIFSAVMYGLNFWKAKSFNNAVHPSAVRTGSNSNASYARERKLSVIGVVLSTLMTIYGILLLSAVTATAEQWSFLAAVWGLVNDIFSWSNPWLCLLLSHTIRKHMIAMIRCKSNAVVTNKNTRAAKREDKL